MLTFLILFSALNLSKGVPIAAPGIEDDSPIVVFGRQLPECMNVARYRTVQGIVLSCLATIFACTWVAIHPNMPGPWDSGRTKFKRQVVTAIYAILAPEFLAMWALQQWIAARRIAVEFNVKYRGVETPSPVPWYLRAQKICWAAPSAAVVEWWRGPEQDVPDIWTLTHGFFIQMGGFMLCKGRKPVRVLTFNDLVEMIDQDLVEVPDVTEKDINDKSKGDFLTKLVVVLQTMWFSFQCLARWVTNLPVTELEVATLAFAALNIVTYVLWWKKPQSTEVAVRIQLKSKVMDADRNDVVEGKESWIAKKLRDGRDKGRFGGRLFLLLRVFILLEWFTDALRRPIVKMSIDANSEVPQGSLRMPMFYADRREAPDMIPVMCIGALFGSIHLIPWSSAFPSAAELWLWHSSALIITVCPLLLILIVATTWFGTPTFPPIYYPARLTLLVLAFTTLRALPQEAYKAIEWNTFIPHV